MQLNPNFRDLLKAFASYGVEYVVIGAYAVIAHGHVRATKDMDLLVSTTPANADNIVRAMADFGIDVGAHRDDFLIPRNIVRFGHPPQQVDIFTSILGVEFSKVWASRITCVVDGVDVQVISRDDLARAKRAAGRYQDLADLEALGIDPHAPPPASAAP